MRGFLYKLKVRRQLFGSLAVVAIAIATVVTLHSGVLDNKIRRRLDRSLRRTQDAVEILNEQAAAKARHGRHLEAIQLYLRALDRNPAEQRRQKFFTIKQQTRIGLCKSLVEVGRFKQARVIAELVLQEEPEYWLAHKILGRVLEASGKEDKAVEHYRNALRAKPTDIESLSALTAILAEGGQREPLVEVYRQYLQAYAQGKLEIRLNDDLVFERNIVINGSWQRLRIPHPGSGQIKVTCEFEGQAVEVWLGEVKSQQRDPMTQVFDADYRPRRADVISMRLGTGPDNTTPELTPTVELQEAGPMKYLELHFAACKPWTEEMSKMLKRAAVGNPR